MDRDSLIDSVTTRDLLEGRVRVEINLDLMKSWPFPTASDLFEVGAEGDGHIDIPEGYLESFICPRIDREGNARCIGCGSPLAGLLLGTFRWGMVNGEGYCAVCRWPTRALHRFKLDGHETTMSFPLQYMPDLLVEGLHP